MSKVVTAEYDATENVLRLAEPLEGFDDHSNLIVTVETPMPHCEPPPASGTLSKEAGESLAHAVNELFPPWN